MFSTPLSYLTTPYGGIILMSVCLLTNDWRTVFKSFVWHFFLFTKLNIQQNHTRVPLSISNARTINVREPKQRENGSSLSSTRTNNAIWLIEQTRHYRTSKWAIGPRQCGLFLMKWVHTCPHVPALTPDTFSDLTRMTTLYLVSNDFLNFTSTHWQLKPVIFMN